MPSYAVLSNDVVINTMIADSKELAESLTGGTCVEFTVKDTVQVGFVYDGTTFKAPE